MMPLGLSLTTKANLLAGKYTFSYSLLVLWWPPLSHSKGKRDFFLVSPWLQRKFKIYYNIPNIGKKVLHQGSRQVLLSHNRHLQCPLRAVASLGQLWLGRRSLPGPAPAVPLQPFPVTAMVLLLTRFCIVLPYPAQFPTQNNKIWLLHTNPDPLQ